MSNNQFIQLPVNFVPSFGKSSDDAHQAYLKYPENTSNYLPFNVNEDYAFSRKGQHKGATYKNHHHINFCSDSKGNFDKGNAWGDHAFRQSFDWTDPSAGISGNKSSASYTSSDGIYRSNKGDAFNLHMYSDNDTYATFIWADIGTMRPQNGSDPNLHKITDVCNTYIPDVIGCQFKYDSTGSHDSDNCAVVNKIALLYVPKNEYSGGVDPKATYQTNIFAIHLDEKISGSHSMGTGHTGEKWMGYKFGREKWNKYKDRFGYESTELKYDKYMCIGVMIEFRGISKKIAYMTMNCKIWDFRPIVVDNYDNTSSNKNFTGDTMLVPPRDKLKRSVGCRPWGSVKDVPMCKIT